MTHKKALQITLIVASCIPIINGLVGLLFGISMLTTAKVTTDLDGQYRFLSAAYLTLGSLILWMIPKIEKMTIFFRIIAAGIILGGVGRLIALLTNGTPPFTFTYIGIGIEFIFIPILVYWQTLVARKFRH